MCIRDSPHPEGGESLLCFWCRCSGLVVAEERDTGRIGVEAFRVSTLDAVAAAATFVDRPEPVDDEVVADVVPAANVDVIRTGRVDAFLGLLGRIACLLYTSPSPRDR